MTPRRFSSSLSMFCLALLAACADTGPDPLPAALPAEERPRPEARPAARASDVAAVAPLARTADQFDTTTEAERRAASAAPPTGAERALGVTVASLGSPGEPGFWLKTPLVDGPVTGRVLYPATGKSAAVDLIPLDGPPTAGSRLSLAAMRLIGAPLTGLPEIEVFRSGG